MGLLRALRDAMRERRKPRIGPAEVERLLAGDPTGPDHRGLAALLDAAQAPASPRELAGEQAAVAGYVAAYREAVPTSMPKGRRRVRIPSPARAAAVKVAAGVAVLAVGGGALAAETGRLPAGAQQRAHDLFSAAGVPAPRTTAPTGTAPATTPTTGTATTPTPAPTSATAVPTPTTATTTTSTAAIRGLCRAWAAQQKPHGKAMTAAARRALAAAAGGADRIPAFCADQLGTPAPTATPTPKPKGKPSSKPAHTAPGNGNGHTPGPKR
jgi:hypothetical protein